MFVSTDASSSQGSIINIHNFDFYLPVDNYVLYALETDIYGR